MSRRHGPSSLYGIILVLALAAPAAAKPQAIDITAQPIAKFTSGGGTRYGKLEFRGGLVLTSSFKDFGGVSGLVIDPGGARFLAITDQGRWLAGRIEADGDRPVALKDVVTTPMLGANGRPLASQGRADVESLTRTPDGYAVGIERRQEIWRFAGADPLMSKGRQVPGTEALKPLGSNEGPEALLDVPLGTPPKPTLVVVAERSPTSEDILPGFLYAPKPIGTFSIARSQEFDATDIALSDGMVYLLERRFKWISGVAMRLRRFPLADIKPGAVIEGEVLIEAERGSQIDNMEALALHKNAAGETIVTMMSDDNFSPFQRTLLLRFAVVENPPD